jgi:hypothetical protein
MLFKYALKYIWNFFPSCKNSVMENVIVKSKNNYMHKSNKKPYVWNNVNGNLNPP